MNSDDETVIFFQSEKNYYGKAKFQVKICEYEKDFRISKIKAQIMKRKYENWFGNIIYLEYCSNPTLKLQYVSLWRHHREGRKKKQQKGEKQDVEMFLIFIQSEK